MLEVGASIPPRALFGKSFRDLKIHCTLQVNGVPVAAIANVSRRTPTDCRFDDLENRFQGSGWKVYRSSSRESGCSWTFFAIIYRPQSVTKEDLRRVRF